MESFDPKPALNKYAGKTIANEDGTASYRLRNVTGAVNCIVDDSAHGRIAAETLRADFADRTAKTGQCGGQPPAAAAPGSGLESMVTPKLAPRASSGSNRQ